MLCLLVHDGPLNVKLFNCCNGGAWLDAFGGSSTCWRGGVGVLTFTGDFGLLWAPCCCFFCCRNFALRFLNHTFETNKTKFNVIVYVCIGLIKRGYDRAFLLMWPSASILITSKGSVSVRIQFNSHKDWFGTPEWRTWSHVKRLYTIVQGNLFFAGSMLVMNSRKN